MDLVFVPALLAICLKLVIFVRYHDSLRKENLNLGIFFVAILYLNIIEFFAIDTQLSEQTALQILTAYYCGVIFIIHGFVNLSLEYSEFNWKLREIRLLMNVLLAIMILAIIFSRDIIAGTTPTEISLTKIAGPYYWTIQVYLIVFVTAGLTLLAIGIKTLSSNLSRQRCFVMLISALPPALVSFAIIIVQQFGSDLTSAVVQSLAFTLMLCILVYAEEKSRLFRLLTIVPFTKERKLHKQLLAQITECITINDDPTKNSSLNLKEMMKELEGTVVEHVLDYYDGNQKYTASALGVSEATVSRRARAVNGKVDSRQNRANYENGSIRITQ